MIRSSLLSQNSKTKPAEDVNELTDRHTISAEELKFRSKAEFGDALGYGYLNENVGNVEQHSNSKPALYSHIRSTENDPDISSGLGNERSHTSGQMQSFQEETTGITDEELYHRQRLEFFDALGYYMTDDGQ